jgi:hypothetical protein
MRDVGQCRQQHFFDKPKLTDITYALIAEQRH